MAHFKKGQSGNPKGRPKGATDRRNALRGLLEPHAPELVEKAVELALEGDATALRMCLDRLIPSLPADSSPVVLGPVADNNPTKAGEAILAQAFSGTISPETAQRLLGSLRTQTQIAEVGELEERITALEAEGAAQ